MKSKRTIHLLKSKEENKDFKKNNRKKEKYNQDYIIKDKNQYINNNKINQKNRNIITYSNSDNEQDRDKQNENNLSNINDKKILSKDKFIQTPSNFYSFINIEKLQKKCLTPNYRREIKKENRFKTYIRNNNYENNNIIPRIISRIKPKHFSKSFYNKYQNKKNTKISRNHLYPILNSNKPRTKEIQKYLKNINILKEYFNNISQEKKTKHHNLLTIENIYFQKRPINNIYKINNSNEQNLMKNKNTKLSMLQKKYSIKEIKYPFNERVRKYKIINENNDHLLEEIFKKQTLSNFNNKYNLKYKTNSSVKKENIETLFSLLKKYKYSDEEKRTAFNKYNSMKKIKKTFNI